MPRRYQAKGRGYGERKETEELAAAGRTDGPPPPAGGGASAQDRQSLADRWAQMQSAAQGYPAQMDLLRQPSGRPGEPITSGLSQGPGPGPEALGSRSDGLEMLRAAYQVNPAPEIARMLISAEYRRRQQAAGGPAWRRRGTMGPPRFNRR